MKKNFTEEEILTLEKAFNLINEIAVESENYSNIDIVNWLYCNSTYECENDKLIIKIPNTIKM